METVYRDIKPKVMENVESAKNHDDPRKVKLPFPIKWSTLCKQCPKTDQAYCDTEEPSMFLGLRRSQPSRVR